jgi:hypothetical protein
VSNGKTEPRVRPIEDIRAVPLHVVTRIILLRFDVPGRETVSSWYLKCRQRSAFYVIHLRTGTLVSLIGRRGYRQLAHLMLNCYPS